jgi:hypothetical protein
MPAVLPPRCRCCHDADVEDDAAAAVLAPHTDALDGMNLKNLAAAVHTSPLHNKWLQLRWRLLSTVLAEHIDHVRKSFSVSIAIAQ